MAVQLRSGKEMSNSRAKEKEKADKKEEKVIGGDKGRSKTKNIIETEKQVHIEQLEKSNE